MVRSDLRQHLRMARGWLLMASGQPVTIAQWTNFLLLIRAGNSTAEAARQTNISYASAQQAMAGRESRNYMKAKEAVDLLGVADVPDAEELSEEAQRGLASIEYFALRYFGIILMPWQVEAAEKIDELLATEEEEYLCINAPPGAGKSVFFAKILPAWMTARNRAIRGMIGSHTQKMSEWYVRRLRSEFDREHPVVAELNDLRLGLAVDAVTTMQADYGAFKPDVKEIWRADQFTILQPDGKPLSQKEPTWSAFGMDSGFLGGRFDLVIWDDVWDPRKMRQQESRTDMYRWWDEVAETRLEPGGLLVLNGQRMSALDIYRYALDKVAPVDDDDDEPPLEGTSSVEGGMVVGESPARDFETETDLSPSETPLSTEERKYHHLKFRAHYDDRCTGNHRRDSAPYPEGCLLFPSRLTWRKQRHLIAQTPDRYQILYQQEDTDPETVLVNPVWVTGGTGPDGVLHLGCWDNDRDLWELPPHIDGNPIIFASADPSPSQFWALQVWAYVPETGFRYLLESYRRKMDAPSFLDWNHNEQRFTGVAEEWQRMSEAMGHKISYWIVEQNAAQKFITQYDHWKRWSATNGVDLVPHYTSRNKGDPKYGVQMLGPLWRQGLVRLPGKQGGHARVHSLLLVNEVTKWTPDGSGAATDDQVMAQWFVEHNLENLYTPDVEVTRQRRPSWLAS